MVEDSQDEDGDVNEILPQTEFPGKGCASSEKENIEVLDLC